MKLLTFEKDTEAQKINAQGNKIAWVHSISNKPGASFDLIIKDGLGRNKFERKNCFIGTKQFGELVNLPTVMGEELSVVVENIKGADKVDLFLN